MIDDDVPVEWIVVPVEAVATTVIGCPCVEPESSTLLNVAIYLSLSEYLH
jgi:hypothetical protein